MKKRLSRFLAFMLVLCMVMTMVPAAFADSNEVQILFLDTSDVHGQQFATDYTQDADKSGTHYQAMTRVATYVKQQRAEYKKRIPERLGRHYSGHTSDILLCVLSEGCTGSCHEGNAYDGLRHVGRGQS